MRTEVIKADTIDEAAEEILKVLKEDTNATRSGSSRDNVIYFDGWDGLGASAVLRTIARRVTPTTSPAARQRAPAGLEFEQVIHIDCSIWENRRALQRAVAEKLKLPDQVMKMFDRQDEEDDYRGVPQGMRTEVQRVIEEMYQHILKLNCRFLVIFHNGSSDEVDLASLCGFPLFGFSTNKVLWTFQGRFRLIPQTKFDAAIKSAGTTNAFLSATSRHKKQVPPEIWSYLVLEEALEVAETCKQINTGPRGIMDKPKQVVECFLYMMELCCRGSQSIDYDLATHSTNYWVCDGIIQWLHQGERGSSADNGELWRAADALKHEMRLDMDYYQSLPSTHSAKFVESKPYWSSPTYGFTRVPAGVIPNGDTFQHYLDKLTVLKLSHCTFTFESPPFCHCSCLRFLWLDHCQGTTMSTDGAGKEEDVRRCFQRLWVLDLRYTDCGQILSKHMLDHMTQLQELNVMGAKDLDMGQLQGRLPNIRKLRVTKSSICSSRPGNSIFLEMNKMELLEFSGNDTWNPFNPLKPSGLGVSSSNSCLETVIVNDCNQLDGMSFSGCTKLNNILLGGDMGVRSLDISDSAVKTLDLSAITAWGIRELRTLHCEKLCAILWPTWNFRVDQLKLFIDTTHSASTARTREEKVNSGSAATQTAAAAAPHEHGNGRRSSDFDWDISVKDARLLFSLESVYYSSRKAHVEVSSPARPTVTASGSKDEGIKSNSNSEPQAVVSLQGQIAPAIYGADSTMDHLQQASEGDGEAPGIASMWPCPDLPSLPEMRYYMHIQDQMRTQVTRGGEKTGTIAVPKFVVQCAKILHVHDCLSIAAIPSAAVDWSGLEWCRIERCPKLESVFSNKHGTEYIGLDYGLRTFWASQLLKACYICKWSASREFWRTFSNLTFLHLDCCPRLIHAFPLSKSLFYGSRMSWSGNGLNKLETIEIMWCGDLVEVFPLDDTDAERHIEQQQPITAYFPKLKHIHLHELPSLRCIYGVRMSAPNLETVKIRGCWSLKRLPIVDGGNKAVECDCEEWWEKLQWDHHRSHARGYKPIHPRHYKKSLLRRSVLR